MTAAAAFLPGDAAGLDDTCARAMNLQLTGQLERAERLYLSILSSDPEHALANHCLGMLKVHLQQPAEGLPYLLSALNTHPELPDYWLGYLEALLGTGQIQETRLALALAREHGLAGAAVDDFTMRLATHPTPTSQGSAAPPIAPLVPPTTAQSTRAHRRRRQRTRRIPRLRHRAARLASRALNVCPNLSCCESSNRRPRPMSRAQSRSSLMRG